MPPPRRVRPVRRSVMWPCTVVRERDFRLVARHMLDLSEDGLFALADLPVLTGEPLIVSFRAPLGPKWIDAEASVARVVHARRKGDRARGLGIVFDRVDQAGHAALIAQLGWFGETKPTAARQLDSPTHALPKAVNAWTIFSRH